MTTTDVVYAAASLEERKGYALALSRAGDLVPKGFRDRNGDANPGKILLAAEYGNMLGLHPMAALTGINVIEGKPSPAPSLMSALVRKAGHKLRVKTTGTVLGKDITVTVTLIRADDPDEPFVSTWDIDKATRAELWGKSGSWSKYPEAMLKWRAMSEVCRDGAEDVLMGAHYVPEELGATVNEAGDMVDLTATTIDRTPPKPTRALETEAVDAEVMIDEQTGEVAEPDAEPAPEAPAYDEAEADEWAAQISGVPEIGTVKARNAIEADTLCGVFLRAEKAGVLDHLADNPDRIAAPKTIRQLISDRRLELEPRTAS